MIRKTAAALLTLALAAPPAPAGMARNPDCFVHLTTRSWFTLDPHAAFDAVSYIATANVYEPLIAPKDVRSDDEFVPFLAAKVPSRKNGLLSKDGRVYTFPIRKGVRFHDGAELTPEDVRYSLLRFMLGDPEGGPSALLLKPILGVYSTRDVWGNVAIDFDEAARAVRVEGGSVVVTLKAPDATFLKALSSLPIIVSLKWAAAHGEWDGEAGSWTRYNNRPLASSSFHAHMNGTGPFRLESADPEGRELVLDRHAGYWRKPAALKRVLLRVVPSKPLRLSMLENGDADASYFETRDFAEVESLSGVRILPEESVSTLGEVVFFTFHTDPKSPFLGSARLDGEGAPPNLFYDLNVREGFAYALDYESYLSRGLALRGERAGGPIPERFLPDGPGPRHKFSLDKAEESFRKALGGKLWETGFTVTLGYSTSNAGRIVLAEILREGLKKVNPKFRLRLQPMSSAELYEAAEARRLPLFISGYYADYPDPHTFAFGMLHGSGYYPRAQAYANAEIDGLIDRAAAEPRSGRRQKLYRRAVELAAEDVPHLVTYYPRRFRAARDWVKGLDHQDNVNNLNLNNFPYFYAFSK